MGIIEQLTYIYEHFEPWHEKRMSHEEALKYHQDEYDKGNIHVHLVDGKVLGYYQRYFLYNTCFLWNVFVDETYRGNGIFKKMRYHFFSTMPKGITKIVGEKQSIGGKVIERKIYGKL